MDDGLNISEMEQRREDAERRFNRAVWVVGFSFGALTTAWIVFIVILTNKMIDLL